LVGTLLLTREHTVRIAIVNLVEMMEEIKAARTTIEQLTTERNELDKNSSAYAQIHTNITNDIVARTALLNTLISQQGNSFPDFQFQFQFLTDSIPPPILLQTLHPILSPIRMPFGTLLSVPAGAAGRNSVKSYP
jgi:hypothetical protein